MADLCERVARNPLDVANLADGSAEIAVGDLGGQLRLQDDDRERVAKKIVQVAGDSLALGGRRHLLGLFMGLDERAILPPHFTEVDVRAADQKRHDQRRHPEGRRQREQQRFNGHGCKNDEEPAYGDGRAPHFADECGGKNEEAARARIARRHDHADEDDAEDDAEQGAAVQPEAAEVEHEEQRHRGAVDQPVAR